MNDHSTRAYPADYYYPEFIYSRPDDPQQTSPAQLPLVTSVDNGTGSSTKVPTTVQHVNEPAIEKPMIKPQSSTRLAIDVTTDQGLPDMGMSKIPKTDPKSNLLRDPAARNIPRLIVDDSVIRQTLQTPRATMPTNLDNYYDERTMYNQMNNGQISRNNNGHINGDLLTKTKSHELGRQQTGKYIDDQQAIDDHWKREVFIDDRGVVSIEPIVYEEPVYEGPFGMTRIGSYIFYIGLGIFTLLAAVFLIMCGVFYSQNYPSASSNTGSLTGIGICAFAFYLGLQLILIGIWHQKQRKEKPKSKPIITKSFKQENSPSHIKSTNATIEDNTNPFDYSYQQQMEYTPYGNYPAPPYIPNATEPMFLQPTGIGTGFYQPAVWPSDVASDPQINQKFFQPMDWTYGQQQIHGATSTTELVTPNKDKVGKKGHKRKKTIEVDSPKVKSENVARKPVVDERPLPSLSKAPETKETIEKNAHQTSSVAALTKENVSRINIVDGETEPTSSNTHRHRHNDHLSDRLSEHQHRRHHHHHHDNHHSHGTHHHHDRHSSRHHHQHHRRRRRSYSPCSLCSRNEFYSEVSYDPHHHHVEPIPIIFTPHPPRSQHQSPRKTYRDEGVGTETNKKPTQDSSVMADLEDISNNHDSSLSQIPIVRRTVIVEPYPAEPSSQIVVTPHIDMVGKLRLDQNQNIRNDTERSLRPLTIHIDDRKPKRKKSTTESKDNIIEDLNLDDVNENSYSNFEMKRKKPNKILTKKTIKNAFYN